jgi:HK97 gp10 family phage protein
MELKTTLKWDGDIVKLQGKKVVGKSLYDIGLVVEGQAKQLAPVDTGRLAGSISTEQIDKNQVEVGTNVSYAPYMEFGTVKTQAQAFLRPALALARGKALTLVKIASKYYFADYIKD